MPVCVCAMQVTGLLYLSSLLASAIWNDPDRAHHLAHAH